MLVEDSREHHRQLNQAIAVLEAEAEETAEALLLATEGSGADDL